MYIGEFAERIAAELAEELFLPSMAEQEAENVIRRILESCEGEALEG